MLTASLFAACGRRRAVTWSAGLVALTLPFLLLAPTGATDPPEKSKSVFCPVVGLPECRTCNCPSGYCSTTPQKGLTVAFEGGKLLFCCGKCKQTFEKSPAKFAANARHQLVATGQARQEKCPLCGGEPKQTHASNVGGVTVHFCSAECRDKVATASPADRVGMLFGEQAFARGFTAIAIRK